MQPRGWGICVAPGRVGWGGRGCRALARDAHARAAHPGLRPPQLAPGSCGKEVSTAARLLPGAGPGQRCHSPLPPETLWLRPPTASPWAAGTKSPLLHGTPHAAQVGSPAPPASARAHHPHPPPLRHTTGPEMPRAR